MKIGEIAEQLGTTISALRFYETKGLITPCRSQKGTRFYTQEHLDRFRTILNLTELDISLETIHTLTQIRPHHCTGNAASHAVETELDLLEHTLAAKFAHLEKCITDIKLARKRLAACHGCRKKPITTVCAQCPESAPLLQTDIMHIVWDEEK